MPQTKHHFIVDSLFGNMPVASFEVPHDWRPSSTMQWVFGRVIDPANDFAYPANLWARAEDSNGDAAFERFAEMNFYFLPQAMLGGFLSNLWGQAIQQNRWFGATSSEPVSGVDAVVNFLLPWVRAGVADLRVVGQFDPRDYTAKMPVNPATNPEPVGVLIEYSAFGRHYEEEIYAIKTQWDVPGYSAATGPMVQINWQITMAAGLRATKGTLAQRRPELFRIMSTSRSNPKWIALYQYVMQNLQQAFNAYIQQGYDAIAAAGAVSQQITNNNNAMLAHFEQQHLSGRAQWDHARRTAAEQEERTIAQRYSDQLRDVNVYVDSDGKQYQHSIEHDIVWRNSNGGTYGTNDPSTDPNLGSTTSWERLRRV
jgi:hypothetical protein